MILSRHGRRLLALLCLLVVGGCNTSRPAGPQVMNAPPRRTPPKPPTTPPPAATRVVTIGQSVEGRPINMHLFGDPAAGSSNTVLIFGGIHGNEPTSAGVCRNLVSHLSGRQAALQGKCVAIIPEANPDGLHRRLRTNTNLVDLNRNFPAANWKKTRRSSFFGGDAPATEPETKALIKIIEQMKPARIVSVHSMAEPCNNYDGPGESLARRMAQLNGYDVKASIGYPTPGSFGSWAGGDRRIPVITLELPSRGSTEASWAKNRDALLVFIGG